MSELSSLSRDRRTDRAHAGRTVTSTGRLLNYLGFGLSLSVAAALILGLVA